MKKSELKQLIKEVLIKEKSNRNFKLTSLGIKFFDAMKEWCEDPDFNKKEGFTDTYLNDFNDNKLIWKALNSINGIKND